MGFIWSLIVGGIIGAIAGAITNKGSSMGIIANVIAGFSWVCNRTSFTRFMGSSNRWNGNRSFIDWSNHTCIDRLFLCS